MVHRRTGAAVRRGAGERLGLAESFELAPALRFRQLPSSQGGAERVFVRRQLGARTANASSAAPASRLGRAACCQRDGVRSRGGRAC